MHNNYDSLAQLNTAGGEQGATNKTTAVQKDYKIRQTSSSPARVQRQNSDRTIRRQEESINQINTQMLLGKHKDFTYNNNQLYVSTAAGGSTIPQIVPNGVASSMIAMASKISKTPVTATSKQQ